MLKKRVIPALLIKDNLLVKTKKFKSPRSIGSIIEAVKLYDLREVDELVLLDISNSKKRNEPNYSTIVEVSKECFVPLCVGGGINDIKTIYKVLKSGADKISINTQAFYNPKFVKEAAKEFGSQCIVVSIDYYKNGKNSLLNNNFEKKYYLDEYVDIIQDMGAGEIILTCVDKDGTNEGFDYETIKRIKKKISIPIIASGGAGKYEHMLKAFKYCNVDAVLASSIFCFSDKTPKNAKFFLQQNGINVRT
jgi:imidazole glycerol-phosphate synthase subunit HisF